MYYPFCNLNIFDLMDIKIEDVIFTFLTLILFVLFFAFLFKYDSPFPSLAVIWIGMTLLLVGHSYVYIRKKRDMRILKMHVVFLDIPFYLLLIYLSYHEIIGYDRSPNESLLISVIILIILIINFIGEFILRRKK